MLYAALTLAWLLGLIYATIPIFWLAIHPFADKWRGRKGRVFTPLGGVWLAAIIVMGLLTRPWRFETLYSTPWSLLPGGALFALDIYLLRKIGRDFGSDRLIGRHELNPQQADQRLITTGMHARMRHPIYLAHFIMLTAWTVGSGLLVMYGLLAFAIVTGAFMIDAEDIELERRFGEQYLEYKKRVWALWPFPKRPRPDRRDDDPTIEMIFQELLREIPEGTAQVVNEKSWFFLRPTNPAATEINGTGSNGEYIVGAGSGPWHEHLKDPAEVKAFCRWVMAGNFKEKIVKRGEKVASSTLYSPQQSDSYIHGTFLIRFFNPFKKKTVEIKEYEPFFPDAPSALRPKTTTDS